MSSYKKEHSLKRLALVISVAVFVMSFMGCSPCKECVDIRVKIEEDGYLDGWVYVKVIDSLDGKKNSTGRTLFALYENEENSEEYAVLEIEKLTVPDNYNGKFVNVSYNNKSNTAESLENSNKMNFRIVYDSSGIEIKKE